MIVPLNRGGGGVGDISDTRRKTSNPRNGSAIFSARPVLSGSATLLAEMTGEEACDHACCPSCSNRPLWVR